jgi:putative phosphoesterase
MSDVCRLLVVADTHLREGQSDRLVDRLRDADLTDGVDVVLHAGDLTHSDVLDALATIAPVHAVLGNNDHGIVLPERIELSLGERRIAMVHDSGPSAGRTSRLRRWFPSADIVVFGHSHVPWHETHVDASGHVQHQLNPGSATQRRRQPRCTVAVLELSADVVTVDVVGV